MLKLNIKNSVLDIELNVKQGELVAIVGDSGSGKTTLLRAVAGLNKATGYIEVDGKNWLKNSSSLSPQKRSVGFVMQDFGLFENMSVIENLLFVNRDLSLAKRLLSSVNLWELKSRYPAQLSGGQKQRVALVRALIKKPKILLLDEPLSALHPSLRYALQKEILKLHKEFNLTTLLVSHDISEVAKMANRVITIRNGKIQQIKNIEKPTNEQQFLLAQIVDKTSNSKKYEFTLNLNNSYIKTEVEKDKYNSYNIGDLIEAGVKI